MYQSDKESEMPSLWPPIIIAIVLAILIGLFGCGPQRRPENQPFPKTVSRFRVPQMTWQQARCFGGGIGGCSLSGKALEVRQP